MNNDYFHGSSMNKIILGLILCLSLFSCDNIIEDNKCEQDIKYVYPVGTFWTHVIIVDNHKYIVIDKYKNNSGVAIIHAESCECKNIKE